MLGGLARRSWPSGRGWGSCVHSECKLSCLLPTQRHPDERYIQPGSGHASALAIGDAAVLGTLFSHIHHRDQIPRLLAAFQELRQGRCESVGKWELGIIATSSLPPGPQRDARDAQLKNDTRSTSSGDGEQETFLEKEWEEFWRVFEYDPYEAADEWWVEWGVLPDRMDGWDDTIAHLCVEVRDECNLTDSD